MGPCADALGRLEELQVMSPEVCQAKKPWHRNCDVDALRMASCAVADEDIPVVKAVEVCRL